MSDGHRDSEDTENDFSEPVYRQIIESPDPRLNEITKKIIAAAIEVHRHLGPGYQEAYYGIALAKEFALRGIRFIKEHKFAVSYKGEVIGSGKIDFFVEDEIVVELKSVESLAPVHTAQVLSYLKATDRKLGLIINFNAKLLKDGLKRVAR